MRPDHPVPMCRVCLRHRFLRPLRHRWPLWLLLGAAVLLVTTRFVELKDLGTTLAEGRWQWMAAAIVLQAAYYFLYAVLYRAGYATVGVESRVLDLIPVMLASIVVGTLTPAGGLSSAAVMIDGATRRHQSAARAAEGVLLVWVAGVAMAVPLLAIGLGYLRSRGVLVLYEVLAALAFILYAAALFAMLFLAKWRDAWLRAALGWVQGLIDALLARMRRPGLPEGWAERNAGEAAGAAAAIAARPRLLGLTLALALGTHLLNLASLAAIFLAFDHALAFGALSAAYTLGFVLAVLSVIPFDLGVLAGVMALVYSSVGVPVARALVISVAFRGINAWLPVALGFLLVRRVWPGGGQGPAGPDTPPE